MKKNQHGLTLLSLLVYILALAVLGVIAYSGWTYIKQSKEDEKKKVTAQVALQQLERFQSLAQEWDPALRLAASTSRIALATPVQRMQDIRSKTNNQPAEGCVADAKRHLMAHMDYSIEAFLEFMQDHEYTSGELLKKAKDSGELAHNYLNDCKHQAESTLKKLD